MTEPRALPLKLFYRIGEVSELVGVEPHVLRYWESEFKSIRPQKSPKGQRVYSRRDLEKLLRVKELLYTDGFTIAGARKQLKEGGGSEQPSESELELARARVKLVELRGEIQRELARLSEDEAGGS